ncbi:alpha/beta fold hydrolase [Mycolicibacterium sp.]|uniref:alpha/beta fold hydrolase n=1 Tax=Mycolicibacterium sp. TaxID=2320850 RepID=UPI0037C8AC7E
MTDVKDAALASGTLHVESTGNTGGRLVLCVHGLSANCRSFDRIVPVLSEAGCCVVAMDLRGRGHSAPTSPGSYGWPAHARDLLEIADLYQADSFDVVGHSMGGYIGMELAARYPDRCGRLVVLDAAGIPPARALLSIGRSLRRLGRTYSNEQEALAYVREAGTVDWSDFWANYFTWELALSSGMVHIRTDASAIAEDAAWATPGRISAVWPRINCPVLLVRATRPMATGGVVVTQSGASRFANAVPSATVVGVRADHYSILTDETAIDAVRRHLTTERPKPERR